MNRKRLTAFHAQQQYWSRDDAPELMPRSAAMRSWVAALNDVLNSAPADVSIRDAREFAAERLRVTGRLNGWSPVRYFELWRRLEMFAAKRAGVTLVRDITPELVAAFVNARTRDGKPAHATQQLRRTSIRLLFRVLRENDLMEGDPTIDVPVGSRVLTPRRALTTPEVEEGRFAAMADTAATRAPAVWALAECGLWAAELSIAEFDDLDFEGRTIQARGSAASVPRVVPMTDWAFDVLARRTAERGDGRLVYDGEPGASYGRGSSAVRYVIRRVLKRAGLDVDTRVNTESPTSWAGLRVYEETGRIDLAAKRLGFTGLDKTARRLGIDWAGDA